jgi:hypothetical protein
MKQRCQKRFQMDPGWGDRQKERGETHKREYYKVGE